MKANAFNICPTCVHKKTCVLTTQKSQVWSCSEYEEKEAKTQANIKLMINKKDQAKRVMA